MPNIFDVANWFLSKEPMTHKKLQKLCYYYKAWGLALYDVDLLPDDEFQAWIHGPVNPSLYQKYKDFGWNDIPQTEDNTKLFNSKQLDILESVWDSYGDMSANSLEAQTHAEKPWRFTRGNLSFFDACYKPISNEVMRDYYKEQYEMNQGD